jgi:hypothetical protein
LDSKNQGVIIANPNTYGKSGTLTVTWNYLNSAGAEVSTRSELTGLKIQKNSKAIPWTLISPLSEVSYPGYLGLYLDPGVSCSNLALPKSKTVTCKGQPVIYFRTINNFEDSKLLAEVNFNVSSIADGCSPQNAGPISGITGKTNSYTFKVVGSPIHNLNLDISSIFGIPEFNQYQMNDGSFKIYLNFGPGTGPFDVYGSGANCHSLSDRSMVGRTSGNTVKPGKIDKSSNAYKVMFAVGKNFAKVSTASDSANSQCTSAMQTGIIKAGGIPRYLGAQAASIQSYLQTASGFQGCLDGFGH